VVDCKGLPVAGANVVIDNWLYLNSDQNGDYFATVGAELPFTVQCGVDFVSDTALANGDTLIIRDLVSGSSPFDVFVYGMQIGNRIEITVRESGIYPPVLVSFDNGQTFQEGTSFIFDIDTFPDFPQKVIVKSGKDSCQQKEVKVRLYNPTITGGCSMSDYDVLALQDSVGVGDRFSYPVNFVRRQFSIPSVGSKFDLSIASEGIQIWGYRDLRQNKFQADLAVSLNPCLRFVSCEIPDLERQKPVLPRQIPSSLTELHLYYGGKFFDLKQLGYLVTAVVEHTYFGIYKSDRLCSS
jgi:hypothetical protein